MYVVNYKDWSSKCASLKLYNLRYLYANLAETRKWQNCNETYSLLHYPAIAINEK